MMKKVGIFLFVLLLLCGYSKNVSAYVFTQTLKLGQTHADVKELQKVLNQDVTTKVSISGTGSSGQETSFFGQMTYQAVIRFQNKYASEVLSPNGLSSGTGFVGAATLKKLNQVSFGAAVSTSQPLALQNQAFSPIVSDPLAKYTVSYPERINIFATDYKFDALQKEITQRVNTGISGGKNVDLGDLIAKSAANVGTVFINSVSAQVVASGGRLSLNGQGFEGYNTLYFGNTYAIKK